MAELNSASENGDGSRLHHIGYVVASIHAVAEQFAASVKMGWDGRILHDPLQSVYVSFLHSQVPENPMLELVEPAGQDSAVQGFCKRGGGLHHLCYEVEHLDEQLKLARECGGLIARKPLPAVAFAGRRIAWVYTKNRLLLEYLERCCK